MKKLFCIILGALVVAGLIILLFNLDLAVELTNNFTQNENIIEEPEEEAILPELEEEEELEETLEEENINEEIEEAH